MSDSAAVNQDARELELLRSRAFSGSYSHSLDGKGRLIVPTSFREALGSRLTVGPSLDCTCVALYPQDVWDELIVRFQKINPLNKKAMQFVNTFRKFSFTCQEIDSQGRLLLPAKLRKYLLPDVRDVEVSGGQNCVLITAEEKADSENEAFFLNPDTAIAAAEAALEEAEKTE